ncbi:MAG: hypothetical protein E6J45_09225 [Chloroflexi bacterium]|nr:MAG: hypothetical protein E6J45_09225 [Chloroflexota bacterium]
MRHPDAAAGAERPPRDREPLGHRARGRGARHEPSRSRHLVRGARCDLITRLALGLADDAVTTTALASRSPLLLAPAMEAAMWEHPATQASVATLVARGARVLGPVRGRLASGREDTGRMVDCTVIVDAVEETLGAAG